ncbi:MAG: hypothetical protein U1D32_01825 [Patescibacteria group bacterium]|nr:hypothetical protein [Patescibacteria group bacterium]
MKLKCFEHATSVLRDATLVKEVRKVRIKKKGKWKKAIQYGIVHEVKRGKRIRVVVEKIGKTGKHKFVSVMPEDNASKY